MTTKRTRALTNQYGLRIVCALKRGPQRFNALERAIEAPNPPALSKLLKRMQRDGLVARRVIAIGPPAHVEYSFELHSASILRGRRLR